MDGWVNSINLGGTTSKLVSYNSAKLPNHAVFWVDSVRDYFRLEKSSTATADGITIITPGSGTGRWIRENRAAPQWLLQTAWFVDPSAGNDENSGVDSGHALKTHAELERRWGTRPTIPQTTDVTLLGDLPTSDPLRCLVRVAGSSVLKYHGTQTTIVSGSFTAVTARNAASNQPLLLTDTGLPAQWSTYITANARVRITSGPRAGSICWPAKDLGSHQARFSPCITLNTTYPVPVIPTEVTPQVGDAYVIETLSAAPIWWFDIQYDMNFSTNTTQVNCVVESIFLAGTSDQGFVKSEPGANIVFQGCYAHNFTTNAGLILNACKQGFILVLISTSSRACMQFNTLRINGGGNGLIDYGTIAQGVPLANVRRGGTVIIGDAASFDSTTDGLVIETGSEARLDTVTSGVITIWGSGASGYGIRCDGHASFSQSATKLITGASGDLLIGGVLKSWAEVPFVEDGVIAAITAIPV